MDVFSLEEDDARELFITQTPKENDGNDLEEDNFQFGINKSDFASPCVSVVDAVKSNQYSDISEDDDEVFHQNQPNFK